MFFTAGAAVRFDHKHGKLSFCSPRGAKRRGIRLYTLFCTLRERSMFDEVCRSCD